MNEIQKGVIALLKSAITGKGASLPENFDLEQAMPLIQKHNMVPLAYEGALLCGVAPGLPVMQQLFRSYCKAVQVTERQQKDIRRVCGAFDAGQIDYMLLKGSRIRELYPKPELRLMGDADILIRLDQYGDIVPIMESLGFEMKTETDHELVWETDGLYLELHKCLIPTYNKDLYGFFGDGWKLAKPGRGTRYVMSTEDEWIFLFTHFAKHYRDGGIGLRHVADLWVWRRAYPQMDETYIRGVLQTLWLDVFYGNVLRLLDCWFGEGAPDEVLEILSASIFSSGSFGTEEIRVLSRTVRDAKKSALGCSGKLVYLKENAFPDVLTLRGKYTVLKKAPWLLPAVWIVRPFYKLLWERKSMEQKIRSLEVLTKEKLDERQELLLAVGLDYHM